MSARPCLTRIPPHTDPATTAGACHLCKLATTDGRYQRLWGEPATAPDGPHGRHGPPPQPPTVRVRYCSARKVWDWSATRAGKVLDSGSEPTEDRARAEARLALGGDPPRIVASLDESNLAPGVPGRRFNSSLIAYRDGYLLAFRTGWAGSEIGLATLDRELRPTGWHTMLALRHPAAPYGREDPRLFWHRGQLHLSFAGVAGAQGPTNVLYARLSDGLAVEAVHHPAIPGRQAWEKNWAFFEHAGDLYAVYSIAPHRVLKIDGDRAEVAHETPTPFRWSGGFLRGGAAPVFHAGAWWHWFHGRTGPDAGPTYNVGLYTFDPRPPFRIRRMTPDPLYVGDWQTKGDNYAAVFFPAGAVPLGDSWLVSGGAHDRRTEVVRFDAGQLEAELGAGA